MGDTQKLIGMIDGMSWEPSSLYYQLLNREVHRRLQVLIDARLALVRASLAYGSIYDLLADHNVKEFGNLEARN